MNDLLFARVRDVVLDEMNMYFGVGCLPEDCVRLICAESIAKSLIAYGLVKEAGESKDVVVGVIHSLRMLVNLTRWHNMPVPQEIASYLLRCEAELTKENKE